MRRLFIIICMHQVNYNQTWLFCQQTSCQSWAWHASAVSSWNLSFGGCIPRKIHNRICSWQRGTTSVLRESAFKVPDQWNGTYLRFVSRTWHAPSRVLWHPIEKPVKKNVKCSSYINKRVLIAIHYMHYEDNNAKPHITLNLFSSTARAVKL